MYRRIRGDSMIIVIISYGLVFLSIYLQLYYWCGWTNMPNDKRISAICKVIISRALGFIACMVAIFTSNDTTCLYIVFALAFILLVYDVLRLKWQIDEIVK